MKILFTILGSISLALGITGIFLPLLPTTPFLLLTAWLYCKSSPRLYGWLMSHPYLGTYIRNYRDKRAITLSGKIISVSLVWGTILICILFVVDPVWLKIGLAIIPVGVTWHILSFRTLQRNENVGFVRVSNIKHISRLQNLAYAPCDATTFTDANGKIAEGMEFYIIRGAGRDAGYISIRKGEGNRIQFYTLYITPTARGKGYAREARAFLKNYCIYHDRTSLLLTGGKCNEKFIAAYPESGSTVTGSENQAEDRETARKCYALERRIVRP